LYQSTTLRRISDGVVDRASRPGASVIVLPAGDGGGAVRHSRGRVERLGGGSSDGAFASRLALADERGLAGAGFRAIGCERGLPACTDLIARSEAGSPRSDRIAEAPGGVPRRFGRGFDRAR
jgi:hypothetical protein